MRIPIYREVLADLLTPVAAYLRVAGDAEYAFLLESVEGGERIGRYSFVGASPTLALRLADGKIIHQRRENGYAEAVIGEYHDPLTAIAAALGDYRLLPVAGLPRFNGGAVGYLSYEAVASFERLPIPERTHPLHASLPLAVFMYADDLLAFDHLRQRIQIISHLTLDEGADVAAAYAQAAQRIDALADKLNPQASQRIRFNEETEQANVGAQFIAPSTGSQPDQGVINHAPTEHPNHSSLLTPHSSLIFEGYVERAKEYIRAGDIFQVVPSRRVVREYAGSPLNVYRAMRAINPSPYMYYLQLGKAAVVGASPEMLVRVQDGVITSHPIAGTRPRGATPVEDEALAAELIADPKERAEHIMLVDLSRNDIGRVSQPGTVCVRRLMEVERYSHVMHIVSEVEGRLKPGMSGVDALRACFPAGTLSGAPKIRAMQIIAELEGEQRGPYGGAVGYIGYDGNLDTCITIRTVLLTDGKAAMQAGAGIVADSNPASEYRETENKLASVMHALDMAERL
ncbi:MAG: anthranilate synthase component I [Candidatus Chloroheliales bacterium]|nr:MAG: anthranilate synthase component I [Chloroflexota bacterium]